MLLLKNYTRLHKFFSKSEKNMPPNLLGLVSDIKNGKYLLISNWFYYCHLYSKKKVKA